MNILKIIAGGGLILGLVFIPFKSGAQIAVNPLIITWQANNYFPADYAGRALVTPNAPIIASVELVQNNKFIDITQAEIRWYLDDNMIANGTGLKTVSFSAKQQTDGFQTLRVALKIKNTSLENSIQIPISQPAVIISFPSAQKTAAAGSQINLQAIPLFFNVDSLSQLVFDWQINNQKITGQGNQVTVKVGVPQSAYQNSIPISVTVQNSENPYEFNKGFIMLSIVQ